MNIFELKIKNLQEIKKQKVCGKDNNVDEIRFVRDDDNKLYVKFRGEKFDLSRGDDNKLYIELCGVKFDACDFLAEFNHITKK